MDWIDDFISMLFPISRKNLIVEGAYMLKEKHLPPSIFKYKNINDYSINNLEDDSIWLADPVTFNDPYDAAFSMNSARFGTLCFIEQFDLFAEKTKIADKLTEEQIKQVKQSSEPVAALSEILYKDSSEPNKQEIIKFFDDLQIKLYDEMLSDFNESIKASFKICSFSTNLHSILMWGHYTKNHSGFCVEYDLRKIPYGDYKTRFLYPVIYSEDLFDITEYMEYSFKKNEDFNNLYLTLAALCKSKEWSYENEWRLIFANGIMDKAQNYFIGKPKAIYLGAQISEDHQKTIIDIANRKKVPFYKMALSPNKYQLIPKNIEDFRRILTKKI